MLSLSLSQKLDVNSALLYNFGVGLQTAIGVAHTNWEVQLYLYFQRGL